MLRVQNHGVGFAGCPSTELGAMIEVTIVIKCGLGVEFVDILAFLFRERGNGKVLECAFGCFAKDEVLLNKSK